MASSSTAAAPAENTENETVPPKMSPYDAYVEKMDKFKTENGYMGIIMMNGLARPDADEDERQNDTSKITQAEIDILRVIMVSPKLSDKIDEMAKLVLGDQAESTLMMFNTSFSYQVLDALDDLWDELDDTPRVADKLDTLIAYTYILKEYNTWMHDNEGGMDELTEGLAEIWRDLLRESDKQLGWDTEYTKPGVFFMLEKFRKDVESAESYYGEMKFRYQ